MYLKLKQSQITDWWIAKDNAKLAFVNILSVKPSSENLLVVGYYYDGKSISLATSTNRVVKVTKNGVITAKGTFYPFKEAHELYLSFLIKVNQENTLIATNWEYDKESKNRIIADLIKNDGIQRGVKFDFTPNKECNVMFDGYSKELGTNIILTTFARRNICITLFIPDIVKSDIYHSSFSTEEETMKKVRLIQNFFN